MTRRYAIAAALASALACASPPAPPHIVSDGRIAMGTLLDVQLVVASDQSGRAELDAIFDEVAELDALVSHYDPNSEVSKLSASAGGEPQHVDARVRELVALSLRWAAATSGAFDVASGRLVDVWRGKRAEEVAYEDVAAAHAKSGIDGVRLLDDGRVALSKAGTKLDFGGIAKGHALDRVRRSLDERGAGAALLSFGQSSVWARGAPPGSPDGWTLALRSPVEGLAARVTLRDRALSVSSTFPHASGGDTDSTVIDPRTGWRVARRTLAAVVAREAAAADALSTALLVLDYETGIALAESLDDVEALVVDEDGRMAKTSGWVAATHFESLGSGFRSLAPAVR